MYHILFIYSYYFSQFMLLIRESHGLGGLQTAEIYFWRLKSPRPKHRQILYLVRICFFFVSCFRDSVFLLHSHWQKGQETSLRSPFMRPVFMNHFSLALSLNTVTLRIRFQHLNCEKMLTFSL